MKDYENSFVVGSDGTQCDHDESVEGLCVECYGKINTFKWAWKNNGEGIVLGIFSL